MLVSQSHQNNCYPCFHFVIRPATSQGVSARLDNSPSKIYSLKTNFSTLQISLQFHTVFGRSVYRRVKDQSNSDFLWSIISSGLVPSPSIKKKFSFNRRFTRSKSHTHLMDAASPTLESSQSLPEQPKCNKPELLVGWFLLGFLS